MISAAMMARVCPPATSGDIAVINHESSLARAWRVYRLWPDRPGVVEQIIDEEGRRQQFLGDAAALGRLAELAAELRERSPASPLAHVAAAQVASMRHCFFEARAELDRAGALGAPRDALAGARLTIDQACGANLTAVLAARRDRSRVSGTIQDLVPLGALLADMGEYEEADSTYASAIRHYRDVSPFALAWICFHRGVLWGETVPQPDPLRAGAWYRQALDYLPSYVKARVHLAEIELDDGELGRAELLLRPVLGSGDPEVGWRLAQVLMAQSKPEEAARVGNSARTCFEELLTRHQLAYADHAAEFYLSIGADSTRALELARINLANRPTLRSFELAHAAAEANGETRLAGDLATRAKARWAHLKAFARSPIAQHAGVEA